MNTRVSQRPRFKIQFTRDTEVKFADPRTGRELWYGSDYGRGSTLEVVDFISGGKSEIKVLLTDGEHGILETDAVKVL